MDLPDLPGGRKKNQEWWNLRAPMLHKTFLTCGLYVYGSLPSNDYDDDDGDDDDGDDDDDQQ